MFPRPFVMVRHYRFECGFQSKLGMSFSCKFLSAKQAFRRSSSLRRRSTDTEQIKCRGRSAWRAAAGPITRAWSATGVKRRHRFACILPPAVTLTDWPCITPQALLSRRPNSLAWSRTQHSKTSEVYFINLLFDRVDYY